MYSLLQNTEVVDTKVDTVPRFYNVDTVAVVVIAMK